MDSLIGAKSTDPCKKENYGLKLLFLLMCTPCARDKELKYLDDFLNGPEFSLDNISSMSIQQIASKIQKWECKTKMPITYNRYFRKSSHVWNGKNPPDPDVLSLIKGIPCDMHVINWAMELHWIADSSNVKPEFVQFSLQSWVPFYQGKSVNTVLSFLLQLMAERKYSYH